MPMRTRLGATVLGAAAAATAATVACLTAAPALAGLAARTWTVTPGGTVTGTAGATILKDSNTGTTLTCTSSQATGTIGSGSGLANPLGSIGSLSFNNCTGPLGISFSASVTGPVLAKCHALQCDEGRHYRKYHEYPRLDIGPPMQCDRRWHHSGRQQWDGPGPLPGSFRH